MTVARTNGLAIASLVCSLLGLFCGIGCILGIIFGFIARSQIKNSNGTQKGDGMALAGIIVGFVFVVLFTLYVVAVLSTSTSVSGNG